MDTERQKLESAAAALKTGDKNTARDILIQLLKENPQQDDAWVGLSMCATSTGQRKECLQRALRINPNNKSAKLGLARLEAVAPTHHPMLMVQPPPVSASNTQPKIAEQAPKRNQGWGEVYTGLALVLIVLVGGITALVFMLQGAPDKPQTARTKNDSPANSAVVVSAPTTYTFIDFYADW